MEGLDDPDRIDELRNRIRSKPALRRLYEETYERYQQCLSRCPREGVALELGSGGGFAKSRIPDLVTSDVLPYEGVDRVVDATNMDFADGELRAILMMNVFHHIPDVEAFFREAERCLRPGGRVLIIDQYRGWFSRAIYRWLHHEPYDDKARSWSFPSSGPLSGANGALAWMVFERDRAIFESRLPRLTIEQYRPHTPLRYWLSGGLKSWSLLPNAGFGLATWVDRALLGFSPRLASFVDIEVVKTS